VVGFDPLQEESETKDALKPICNAIVVTVRIQSFGTHLRGRRFIPLNWVKSTALLGLDS